MATKVTLESISRQIDKGFSAVAEDIGTLKDDVSEIKATMATKDDIASIRAELADIRRELDELAKKYYNVIGYRKEIDYAFQRIKEIEKHLGMRHG